MTPPTVEKSSSHEKPLHDDSEIHMESSSSESDWEDSHSSNDEEEEDKELLQCLDTLPSSNIKGAEGGSSNIILKAEKLKEALHQAPFEIARNVEHPVPSSSSNAEIIQALESINHRLEAFQSQPSGLPSNTSVSSAQNAARQVAYWSSVFVSMCHPSAQNQSQPPTMPTTTMPPHLTTMPSQPTTMPPQPTTMPPQPTTMPSQPTTMPPQPTTMSSQPTTMSPQPTTMPPQPTTIIQSQLSTIQPQSSTIQPSSIQSKPSSSMQHNRVHTIDTLAVYRKYGANYQSCTDWLESLMIPRKVDSLEDVRQVWEGGKNDCPPLQEWSSEMRNFKSTKGRHVSIYSQRKFIYKLFKEHNFMEASVTEKYGEVKPGKLYKILNSKQK